MLQSIESVVAIYPVSDLAPGYTLRTSYGSPVAYLSVRRVEAGKWTGNRYAERTGYVVDSHGPSMEQYGEWSYGVRADEPAVADLRRQVVVRADSPARVVFAPLTPAAEVAARFFRRMPMTAADLLADPAFRAEARRVAEKGKTFSSELLEWERKPVVVEAVAVVAAEVAAERAEQARKDAAAEAVRLAKLEAERPTRVSVTNAYESCDYRACVQGHTMTVVIGDRVGVSADTHKGDRYSSRCTFRRTTSHHTLYVRADYLTRVRDALGTTTHDGGVILDAEPVGCLPDLRIVYRLRVVRQAAGTGLKVEDVEVIRGTGPAEGRLVEPTRKVTVTRMPAPILADYLQDRDVPEDVTAAIRTA